jgi:AMP-polyphosphate phosphotransferase
MIPMLDKLDLSRNIDKPTYKAWMPALEERLYELQKASWDARVPVAILFEGWDAAGKGTSIQKLTSALDPRGYKLYPIRAVRTYEKKRPWLWRFWNKIPAHGEWAIFDRSWYGRVLVERVENLTQESEWRRGYRDIIDFERTLADDGTLIIKFFLHITKAEQKARFNKLTKDPLTAWHVSPEDWDHHYHYDEWLLAYEEAFERTDTEWGPWNIVEATNRRYTWAKIYQLVVAAMEERLGWPPLLLPKVIPFVEPQDVDEEQNELVDEQEAESLLPANPVAAAVANDDDEDSPQNPIVDAKEETAVQSRLAEEA